MAHQERRCDWAQKLCYGMGHVYNDLCAAMWFSYTLFYLQIVLQMEAKTAGTLIMTGQIVDSLATPIVGWAVDRTGARRAWHLAGALTHYAVIFRAEYTIQWRSSPTVRGRSELYTS
ncbi:hypothetical protein Zmor_003395 [Zophobas morio]|uniref:Uncharacterized protein n=1 Tax=Zophobas morio TaxID=2755281 RepID=A0AA38HNW0_9CUCU|nr:hypothetical protein Zmor_003395 [Zophobas morio]